jgi:DNA uptake protein ComE-like DNA-binding protein
MNFLKEFFYLRKSDRKVILTLLGVIVVALGVIFLTGGDGESNELTPADTIRKETLNHVDRSTIARNKRITRPVTVIHRTKVIYRDTTYRRGKSLSEEEYDSIKAHYQVKIKPGEHVVLNTADTTILKTVPGIGSYFAKKVVEYGQRLGGYVSVDQLDEIEDFPLDAKDFLTIEGASPRKLNVNTLSLNELRRHPYINFYRAKAITDYRRLHGPLKSLQDLRLSKDFPQEAIRRLEPYVEF